VNTSNRHFVPGRIRWAVFIGIALVALAVRLPRLGERPMHTDEAVNGYITGQLLAGEEYKYDSDDRHGPALYFAALPIARTAKADNLSDLTERTVRLVPVIFSVLTVLMFAAVASQIGFVSAVLAALLFAIAPLPVYYSRYFIHEMLFLAGTFAFLLAGWRTLEHKSALAAVAAGISAGFMLACKETALLHFVAFGVAGLWWIFVRRTDVTRRSSRWPLLFKPALAALIAFVILTVGLYTWGGRNWAGPLDLVRSIPRFAARAGGEGHEKPFLYYIALIGNGWPGWGLIALAGLASRQMLRGIVKAPGARLSALENPRALSLQMLTIYGISICLIYSVIPYKNPWLAINLWLPIALLAGVGFQMLWLRMARLPVRIALTVFASALLVGAGRETRQWVFARPADERNPYAYAHTVEDLLGLPERVDQLSRGSSAKAELKIAVVASDPWPLPWYLRHYPNVGYYQLAQNPGTADVYITSLDAAAELEDRLADWRPEFFGVRPEVLLLLWSPPATDPAHE
jgi:uncharacterized protein (TIGR03663 family)